MVLQLQAGRVLTGLIFRIGHLGYVGIDVLTAISALEFALKNRTGILA